MDLSRVEYETAHVDELREFYTDTLGLASNRDSADSFEVMAGDTVLEFSRSPDGDERFYHFALNVPENQVSEAREWLSDRVDVLTDPNGDEVVHFEFLDSHSIYFRDSTGNLLEFTARHSLDNASAEPFDGGSVLGVSEVGLPVRDVTEETRNISGTIGVDPAIDDVETPPIVAVGNDEGAVVVAPIGKEWFMTDDPAEPHPIRVRSDDVDRPYSHSTLPYEITP